MSERVVVGCVSVLSLVIGAALVIMGIGSMTVHTSCPACDAMGGLFGAIFAGAGSLFLIVSIVLMLVVWRKGRG